MKTLIISGNLFSAKVIADKNSVDGLEYYAGTIDIVVPGCPLLFCTFVTKEKECTGSLEQEIISFDEPLFVYDKREVYDFFLEKVCEKIVDRGSDEVILLPVVSRKEMQELGVLFPRKKELAL